MLLVFLLRLMGFIYKANTTRFPPQNKKAAATYLKGALRPRSLRKTYLSIHVYYPYECRLPAVVFARVVMARGIIPAIWHGRLPGGIKALPNAVRHTPGIGDIQRPG